MQVMDEWFIPMDINSYTLRPYWEEATTLQSSPPIPHSGNLSVLTILRHPSFRHLAPADLLKLLPSYYWERPDKDDNDIYQWLCDVPNSKIAYKLLLNEFKQWMTTHWPASSPSSTHLRQFLAGDPWGQLLIERPGGGRVPTRPLLLYEQYNLLVSPAPGPRGPRRDVIRRPNFLWTKDW
jgi:hypothetical protein